MEYSLFAEFNQTNKLSVLPETQEFYKMLEKLREATSAGNQLWATYPTLLDYANICFWAIRKLEYSFAVEKIVEVEQSLDTKMRVLDVGCGVVPLNNWVSRRGHDVIALDPLYADISFLVKNQINNFYQSNVEYLASLGESLPFPDNYFDVITSISVLEHTIPGNDRVILSEIARVLKPNGYMIMTFDVIPQRSLEQGEDSLKQGLRYFNYPFTPDAVLFTLQWLANFFRISPDDKGEILKRVDSLSWEQVWAFWKAAQRDDIRKDALRNYLALGLFLQKKKSVAKLSNQDILAAYRDGQASLQQSLFNYQFHANERLSYLEAKKSEIVEKEILINTLKSEIVEKEILINALNRALYLFRTSISHWWVQGAVQGNAFGRYATKLLRPLAKVPRWIRRLFLPKVGIAEQHQPRLLKFPRSFYKSNHKQEKDLPTISMVTPSYNQGNFIEDTIKSVINQNYPKLEYVVMDGGSADKTSEILKKYKDKLHYSVSQPDDGQTDAINQGFQHTSGEIMAYLNSDDMLVPGSLYYVAEFFKTHPNVDAVYGHRILINKEGGEIGRWIMPPHDNDVLHWADYLPQETLFWRRRLWEKIGASFDQNFKFAMDWDLLVRFIEAGAKFNRLPRPLGIFRVHGAQKTTSQIDIGILEMNRIRKRIHGDIPSTEEIQKNIKPYLRRSVLYHYLYHLGIHK